MIRGRWLRGKGTTGRKNAKSNEYKELKVKMKITIIIIKIGNKELDNAEKDFRTTSNVRRKITLI